MGNYCEILIENFPQIYFSKRESGKTLTTIGVGGKVSLTAYPTNEKQFIKLLQFCDNNDIQKTIIGKGSNIILTDKGVSGLTICTTKLKEITCKGNLLVCSCGVTSFQLINNALSHNLGGVSFLIGIPATVGGMAVCNAGAFGYSIGDFIEYLVVYNNGKLSKKYSNEYNFSYRRSNIDGVVVAVALRLDKIDKKDEYRKINNFLTMRLKQPKTRNCGSVFINPLNNYAGNLIEKCGLKGYTVGGAKVSNNHANFIENIGGATAEDIMQIINKIKSEVYQQHGINLIEEIRFIGDI